MSQWISVKERLPEPSKSVLLALTRTGAILLGDALREAVKNLTVAQYTGHEENNLLTYSEED